MEIKGRRYKVKRWTWLCAIVMLLFATIVSAQPAKTYTVKQGRMYIQLPKDIRISALDSFVNQFDLADLDLKTFLKTNNPDSLIKLGWKLEANDEVAFIISKAFEPFGGLQRINDKIFLDDKRAPLFPATNNGITYGANHFRNKSPFAQHGSSTRFFLRNFKEAQKVNLAGSFNNWDPEQLVMQKTDSGWIYDVAIGPGKYWYKFIVDGHWIQDDDNRLSENDGHGNINSVFYKPNTVFTLHGFINAKKVSLAGSFNEWKPDQLRMTKTASGWELPLYLAEGTHTYKFVVDGKWLTDADNKEKLPNGQGEYNSVLRIGKPHLFKLNGFLNAKQVILAGSFNQWRDFELLMNKTPSGWELPYTIGPGNYEYKFKVDGQWISDPANTMTSSASGNSHLIVQPNYTFRLKGFPQAKQVFLAGDFNGWDPKAYAMKKDGDEWILPVHLSAGKHLYKFIVDGNWIKDPDNKLWEQNEYDTGNSVVWIEQ